MTQMPHLARSQRTNFKNAEELSERIVDAALLLRGKSELSSFFNDLLTRTEKAMLGKRLLIAIFLKQGCSYDQISRILCVGPNTISLVNDRFQSGEGFALVVKKLELEKRIQNILDSTKTLFGRMPRKVGRGRWKSLYPSK